MCNVSMQAKSEEPAATKWVKMKGGIKELLLLLVGFEATFEYIKSKRKSIFYR